MFTTGLKLNPKCPNCHGILYWDNDQYENYLVCLMCAREYNKDLILRRMTIKELNTRYDIRLTGQKEGAIIEI